MPQGGGGERFPEAIRELVDLLSDARAGYIRQAHPVCQSTLKSRIQCLAARSPFSALEASSPLPT
jgi:hypothetical protein